MLLEKKCNCSMLHVTGLSRCEIEWNTKKNIYIQKYKIQLSTGAVLEEILISLFHHRHQQSYHWFVIRRAPVCDCIHLVLHFSHKKKSYAVENAILHSARKYMETKNHSCALISSCTAMQYPCIRANIYTYIASPARRTS